MEVQPQRQVIIVSLKSDFYFNSLNYFVRAGVSFLEGGYLILARNSLSFSDHTGAKKEVFKGQNLNGKRNNLMV